MRSTYTTIDQIKADNKAIGHHWFSPDTMRFFNSRVCSTVYQGHLFISSERFDETTPRLYGVRACVEGKIYTLAKDFSSLEKAELYAARCDWRETLKAEYNLTVE
jgi:hypothetical protein